jgi:hypothetical protein
MKSVITQNNNLDYKPMSEKAFMETSALPNITIKDFS